MQTDEFFIKFINTNIETESVPRKAKEEKLCKKAQKQHMTLQRTKHPETCAGVPAKSKKHQKRSKL